QAEQFGGVLDRGARRRPGQRKRRRASQGCVRSIHKSTLASDCERNKNIQTAAISPLDIVAREVPGPMIWCQLGASTRVPLCTLRRARIALWRTRNCRGGECGRAA